MSQFSNLPPNKDSLPILYFVVLALPHPPPIPVAQNQVATLLALPSIRSSIGSSSQEAKRITYLEITIRNLTNKLTLQERNNQDQNFKRYDN